MHLIGYTESTVESTEKGSREGIKWIVRVQAPASIQSLDTFPDNASEAQKYVTQEAVGHMGGSETLQILVNNLVREPVNFKHEIGAKGQVHFYATCNRTAESISESDRILFRVVSSLYHSYLISANPGATIAGQAIRDTFRIVHTVANRLSHPGALCTNSGSSPELELPTWFLILRLKTQSPS